MTSEDMANALEAARLAIEDPGRATTRSILLAHALIYERDRAERLAREHDMLVQAIGGAAISADICRDDVPGLTGPQLLMLAGELAEAVKYERARVEKAEGAVHMFVELERIDASLSNLRARGCDGAADKKEEEYGPLRARLDEAILAMGVEP